MFTATIRTPHGDFSVQAEEPIELWEGVSVINELFSETRCGLCGCTDLRITTRKNKDEEKFHEMVCCGLIDVQENGKTVKKRCGAYLFIGQNRKGGGLFPVRQLLENGKPQRDGGKFGRHNGWTRFRGEAKPEAGDR